MVKKHGKNARIYVASASLSFANVWEVSTDTAIAEATPFGATYSEQATGIISWVGKLSAYHDQDSSTLFTYATSGASYLLSIYPDYNDTSTYYWGQTFFKNFHSGGNPKEYIVDTSDLVGASALNQVGFS